MIEYKEIRNTRLKYDISQTKLAEFSGFSKSKISAWELGKQTPTELEIKKIDNVLKMMILKIEKGTLNLKKKKIKHSKSISKKLPKTIKDGMEYRILSKNMMYSSEYAQELTKLYKEAIKPKSKEAIKGIALFSGCGGMTLGFEAAGINIVGHVEIAESANRIYAENFPNSKLLGQDICEITTDDLEMWKEKWKSIDIIVGGPPCQGFSLAGKRNPEDERNKLYKQYVRIVSAISPKVFVMENVALMTSMKDKEGNLFIDKIMEDFSKQGYNIEKKILNAYEYGVPQSRERVIIVGIKKEIEKKFVFKDPLYKFNNDMQQMSFFGGEKRVRTFRDATLDLESLESGERSLIDPLHWAIRHPEHVIQWLKNVPEGHSAHENVDPELRPPSGFNTTYKRNKWDTPCSTISTNFSMISGCRNVHPTDTRSLTIREAARIQSFPDEFIFCGNWGDIRKAIGNAVPPMLAKAIAEEIVNQVYDKEKLYMTLDTKDEKKLLQIKAGTNGRLKGHKFEEIVTDELNRIDFSLNDILLECERPNIYRGNPANALISHIFKEEGKEINELEAYWLGGLATAGKGANILNENGEKITGSKSDILMDIQYKDGSIEKVGVSVKACSNNAQMALTTASSFCEMLRDSGIIVSKEAEIGLKMFCGEAGYRPMDGYKPDDIKNIPKDRKARKDRWYWEELSDSIKDEWQIIFSNNQVKITMMLLQCARNYKTDIYKPTYILHECENHEDIDDCRVVIMSVEEFAEYSKLFDSFGIKEKRINKGSYKGIDMAMHQYPHFGFIQFQPIGNKKNFSELQFNLKAKYYNKIEKLIDLDK